MSNGYDEMEVFGLDDCIADNLPIDELETENVTLMMIGVDCSGSMCIYESEMRQCLADFKQSLTDSEEAPSILVLRANYADTVDIKQGYKHIDEFDTTFRATGCTAMYDCIVDGANAMTAYRDELKDEGFRVKCILAIFSDGFENNSSRSLSETKKIVDKLNMEEVTTAFISFGTDAQSEAKRLNFRNILQVGSSASELRRAFNCLSKSVIESSKSVVADGDDFFV